MLQFGQSTHSWSVGATTHVSSMSHPNIVRNVFQGGYLREDDLINQLANEFDKIDVNELGIKIKFEQEVERYRKFRKGVLNISRDAATEPQEIDIKTYAKYLLKEGSIIEKRELLANIKSRIKLKNKQIVLEEK